MVMEGYDGHKTIKMMLVLSMVMISHVEATLISADGVSMLVSALGWKRRRTRPASPADWPHRGRGGLAAVVRRDLGPKVPGLGGLHVAVCAPGRPAGRSGLPTPTHAPLLLRW